ncbi:MAG: hypothetical protein ACMUIG_03130 [Thermoplasmatota archaeon]
MIKICNIILCILLLSAFFVIFSIDNSILVKGALFTEDNTQNIGYTGELFEFNVSIYDADFVIVEYWFNEGPHNRIEMDISPIDYLNKTCTYNIIIPNNAINLKYFFQAYDKYITNATATSPIVSVDIIDNRLPVFSSDITNSYGTTGDEFTFRIGVTDNIAVETVTVEHWFDSKPVINSTMFNSASDIYEMTIIIPSNSLADLHYSFHARDITGYWIETETVDVNIIDNDYPIIIDDLTPDYFQTGDKLTFRTRVDDNIAIDIVRLEYWFDGKSHIRVPMYQINRTLFEYELDIPIDEQNYLHYQILATDTSNNSIISSQEDLIIFDDIEPYLIHDHTTPRPYTGDPFTFKVNVSDNIEIQQVIVVYWYNPDIMKKEILDHSRGGEYSIEIVIPYSLVSHLQYFFNVTDISGNWVWSDTVSLSIVDNDPPVLSDYHENEIEVVDNVINLFVYATDNIDIHAVYLEYWFGDEESNNITMNGSYRYGIQIVPKSSDNYTLNYRISAVDMSGNWVKGEMVSISFENRIDEYDPVLLNDTTPEMAFSGERLEFVIEATDNIGIKEVIIEYWFDEGNHTTGEMHHGSDIFRFAIDLPLSGNFDLSYIFHTTDLSGRINSTLRKIVSIFDSFTYKATWNDLNIKELNFLKTDDGGQFTLPVLDALKLNYQDMLVELVFLLTGIDYNTTRYLMEWDSNSNEYTLDLNDEELDKISEDELRYFISDGKNSSDIREVRLRTHSDGENPYVIVFLILLIICEFICIIFLTFIYKGKGDKSVNDNSRVEQRIEIVEE